MLWRLAVPTTLLALVIAARAALDAQLHSRTWTGSKDRVARNIVRQVPAEMYARWTLDNPGKQCPDSALELAKYSSDREMRDPWGKTLVILCGDASAYGMRVVSAGQDGAFGTRDDITSWADER